MKENKNITVRFRVSETELQTLKSKMKQAKYKKFSDYLRDRAIGKGRKKVL